jgi:hypothetical protein
MMVPNNDNGWRHTFKARDEEYTCRVIGWLYDAGTSIDDSFVDAVIVGVDGCPTVAPSGRTWHLDDEAVASW